MILENQNRTIEKIRRKENIRKSEKKKEHSSRKKGGDLDGG
jgi:hypothetical protein